MKKKTTYNLGLTILCKLLVGLLTKMCKLFLGRVKQQKAIDTVLKQAELLADNLVS